jgi:aspartyl-tRNA(Asn)/glutamyl-tRNA(Gln) amidotransferase subunit A
VTAGSPAWASALAIRDAIRAGETTAEAVCETALARVAALDPSLGAFLHVEADRARARARALDEAGPTGALAGVPVALKDNIVMRGVPTTAGSKILRGYRPPYDATVVARLEAAGAVIIGKTACDEFAMGSSTEHCAFGPARNPWDRDRVPGGSSGGSAVAVAAGMVPLALGSDTGGSIRQPAAFCGIVGLKPTYGRVSRYGLIAFASSLDQIGPLARSAADAALLLDVIAGHDPRDATSADRQDGASASALTGDVAGLTIGVPFGLVESGVDADVAAAFERSLDLMRGLGAVVVGIELPQSHLAVPVYYLVATAEASANLARFDGVRYGARAPSADDLQTLYERTRTQGFGDEVKRRILLGTYVLSAGYYDEYYRKAHAVRMLIRQDFDRAFERVDVVALPTTPTAAFRAGERLADPVQMYLADVFTVAAPLAGLPALSVPNGVTSNGLPTGLHLTGRAWNEGTLLRLADAYERARGPAPRPPDAARS